MTRPRTRVAIVGAGATGLAQLKYLLQVFARPDVDIDLDVVCFEGRAQVGGVWYSEETRKAFVVNVADGRLDILPPGEEDPSPMYKGLVTNLPYDLMSYRDHLFPEGTDLFPDRAAIHAYLVSYAKQFNLYPHIRLNTYVQRLYKDGDEWVIESDKDVTRWDRVIVANGHYANANVPSVPGLSTFAGTITHSRFYLEPEEYAGKTVLVVGSFASGSDLGRQLATLNLSPSNPRTKVYVSASGPPTKFNLETEWAKLIDFVTIIESVDGRKITLQDGLVLDDVEVIIFATGYQFALPFCKAADRPWDKTPVLPGVITQSQRAWDLGGLRGMKMENLDELQLFLKNDRSISFPLIQYQVVPFPLAEVQGHLLALLYANLLPNFPKHPAIPPNPSNPFSNSIHKGDPAALGDHRRVFSDRQELVFGDPYEWTYSEYLMSLISEADNGWPEYWRRIEPWRVARREDKDLRKRVVKFGY